MSKLKNIVIVGGGSSGWLSCVHFLKKFNDFSYNLGNTNKLNITLIESKNIPTIGVGEGSWPNLNKLLSDFNLNLDELNATKKVGINYIDWYINSSSKYNSWYHPFTRLDGKTPTPPFNEGFDSTFKYYNEINNNPGRANHALHFEVDKLVPFLKEKCLRGGINYIQDEVVDCNLNDNGYIDSVILSNNQEIDGDLFIDCTGFKRALISKFNPDFKECKDIVCDSALVTHLDKPNKGNVFWTKATALSSGWTWEIPLRDKTGVGYVYSSKFITAENAVREFNNHLGTNKNFKLIKWKSGFIRKSFIKNCVAIGLSSGFIEPLEATSMGITVKQLKYLNRYIDNQKAYNDKVDFTYRHAKDYVFSHYYLSKRDDSDFWKYVKNIPMTSELEYVMDDYKRYKNYKSDNEDYLSHDGIKKEKNYPNDIGLFYAPSWEHMFTGMNYGKNSPISD